MKRTLPPPEDLFSTLRDDLRHSPAAVTNRLASTNGSLGAATRLAPLPHRVNNVARAHVNSTAGASPLSPSGVKLGGLGSKRAASSTFASAPSMPSFDSDLSYEASKQTLVSWMDHYARELADTESSTMAAEILLQQIQAAVGSAAKTNDDPDAPHALRVAAICAIAEQVCDVVGRYHVILRPVLNELYKGVFMPVGSVPKEEIVASKMASLGIAPKESAYLQHFLSRKPYFEEVEECHVKIISLKLQIIALSSSKAASKLVLGRLGDTWRTNVQRLIFNAWRGTTVKSRSQNIVLSKYLVSVNRRDALQTHFYAWRLLIRRQLLVQSRAEYANSLEQLVAQEATTNAKYLEVEDQLHELRMVVTRLKVEKDLQRMERDKLHALVEGSLSQAEGWRRLTIEVVSFLSSLKKYMASPKVLVGPSNLEAVVESVLQILLGWAGKVVRPLPVASKLKISNFGNDMKDGALLLCMIHVLSNGDVDLAVLHELSDVKARLQIFLDTLHNMGIVTSLTIADIYPPTPEMNFFLVYLLWMYFESPPVAAEDTALGLTGGYRDDLELTSKYVETAKNFYPQWLERRNLLQQYATFVLLAKIKNVTPLMLSEFEAAEKERELEQFCLASPLMVPSCFLSAVNLSPTQRFQNEEERQKVNEVLGKHLEFLKHLFETYSSRRSPLAGAIEAAKLAKLKKTANGKKEVQPPVALESRDILVEMDAVGFYRLCSDCRLVKLGLPSEVNPPGQKGGPRDQKRKSVASSNLATQEPKSFSKLTVMDIYFDIALKSSTVTNAEDPGASPAVFVALLLNLAVHRFGSPIMPSSMQPAPGAQFLEQLIQKDLMPHMVAPTCRPVSFLTELYQKSTEDDVLVLKRPLLRKAFAVSCSPIPSAGAGGIDALVSSKSMCFNDFEKFLSSRLPEGIFSTVAPYTSMVFERSATCLLPPPPALTDSGSGDASSQGSPMTTSPSASFSHASFASALVAVGGNPFTGTEASLRILYGEFEIALAAVAILMNSLPFLPLSEKMQNLIELLLQSFESS